jgi:hypothetical protein
MIAPVGATDEERLTRAARMLIRDVVRNVLDKRREKP